MKVQNLRILHLTFLLFIFLVSFQSCKKSNDCPHNLYEVGIDFQSEFNDDRVEVRVDTIRLLNEKINSNSLLGLAKSLKTNLNQGYHHLQIRINTNIDFSKNIYISKNSYYAINYNRLTGLIQISVSDSPYMYE